MQTSPIARPNAATLKLIRDGTPLLDVRSPGEFHVGKMPNSFNIPILNDDERAQVGTTYKQDGRDAAVKLGHVLVSGALREQRLAAWREHCQRHPDTHIVCWRGGLRSGLAQQWLADTGLTQPKVPGGFKTLRNACLYTLDHPEKTWWLLSGRTGSAKTLIIRTLDNSIDLEGRANHRGSAFGRQLTPQPTPVTFENQLAQDYLTHPYSELVVEDESRTIGRLGLPTAWHEQMQQADIALVEVPFAARVAHIHAEYVTDALAEHEQRGLTATVLMNTYLDALARIKRRMGGARQSQLIKKLQAAFAGQTSHEDWITYLLSEYYDPMYDYQLQKKQHRIAFRGDYEQVSEFLTAKAEPIL